MDVGGPSDMFVRLCRPRERALHVARPWRVLRPAGLSRRRHTVAGCVVRGLRKRVLASEHTLVLHPVVLPRVRLLSVGLLAFGAALQIEVVLDLGAGYVRPLVWGESRIQGGRCLGEV